MSYSVSQSKTVLETKELFDEFYNNEHLPLTELELEYCEIMKKYKGSQEKLKTKIEMYEKKIIEFNKTIKRLKNENLTQDEINILDDITVKTTRYNNMYLEYSLGLPKKPSWFLSKCIGDVDISLYWKKYNYKEAYENLKVNATIFSLFLWIICFLILPYRTLDAVFNAFVLWYFSSLSLQEHILVANGSRILPWWRLHHYTSIIGAGIVMIWPNGYSYEAYRSHYYIYAGVQASVHIMQYTYQKRILYRLRALGVTSTMALTTDGFRIFMWNGFTFLIFILCLLYCFQFYHSYLLFSIYKSELCKEYYPLMLSLIYFIVFTGNVISIISIVYRKATQAILRKETNINEYTE